MRNNANFTCNSVWHAAPSSPVSSVNTWSHFTIKSLHNGTFCGQSGSWKGLSPKFESDSNENKRKKMVAIVVDSD
jgi:hypothetical protein